MSTTVSWLSGDSSSQPLGRGFSTSVECVADLFHDVRAVAPEGGDVVLADHYAVDVVGADHRGDGIQLLRGDNDEGFGRFGGGHGLVSLR